jgi:hypothetical protein
MTLDASDRMTLAVLGTGNVGRTLAAAWCAAGHRVLLAGRDPARTAEAAAACGAEPAAPHEAVAAASVVVLAVPATGLPDAMATLAAAPTGTIVIDATNGRGTSGPAPSNARAQVESAAGGVVYVRAFNTTSWENMADPVLDGRPVDLLWCGPDDGSRPVVERLIDDVGLRPIRLGDATTTDILDGLTAVWFTLAFGSGYGRRVAVGVSGIG